MLNAKRNVRRYLDTIAPWMSGDWNEETMKAESFVSEKGHEAYAVFAIPSRPFPGWFESLLLGEDRANELAFVVSWVTRINTGIDRYNRTRTNRLGAARVAHTAIAAFKPTFLAIRENF